jgi:hypothetical protein
MTAIERVRWEGFKGGILHALIILHAADSETLWRETVEAVGWRVMRSFAKADGSLGLAGFLHYRREGTR